MIKELSSGIQTGNCQIFYFMFFVQANMTATFWMHLYQIDFSLNKEFPNGSIFLL